MDALEHGALAPPSTTAMAGSRSVTLRRELGSERVFAVEEDSPGAWAAEVGGLVDVLIGAPGPDPRHWVVAGLGHGHPAGAPPEVEVTRVALTRSGLVREARVGREGWLVALPHTAGDEPVAISFLCADGSVWTRVELGSLAEMLGPDPDAAPDGGAWAGYAPL